MRTKRKKSRTRSLAPGSAVLEADGRFEAILIREGRSQNGNIWTRSALEDIARLARAEFETAMRRIKHDRDSERESRLYDDD